MQKIAFFICVLILLAGCSAPDEKYTTVANGQEERVQQIEKVLEKHESIEHVNMVVLDEAMLVAIQVKPWSRWKKQKIEQQVKKELEDKFPKEKVTVSTDFKLHWEAGKLKEEKDQKKIRQQVKQLSNLAKEET